MKHSPEGSLAGDTHMHLQKSFSFEDNSPRSKDLLHKRWTVKLFSHKPTDVLLTFICHENTTFTTIFFNFVLLGMEETHSKKICTTGIRIFNILKRIEPKMISQSPLCLRENVKSISSCQNTEATICCISSSQK